MTNSNTPADADDYVDQDSEPTMTAPEDLRPDATPATGPDDALAASHATGAAENPDVLDADEGDAV